MNRVVLMQVDADYEPVFSVAIRSFLLHNPGWPVTVLDFGLRPEQVEFYRKFLTIIREPRDTSRGDRFIQGKSRWEWATRLCRAGHTVLQLDADTITFGKIDEWVGEFERSKQSLGLVNSWPDCMAKQFHEIEAVQAMCPRMTSVGLAAPAWNSGVMLHAGYGAAAICASTALYLRQLPPACLPWGDQSAMHAAIYSAGVQDSVLEAPHRYNYQLNFWPFSFGRDFLPHSLPEKEPITIIHNCGMARKILAASPPWTAADALWWHWAVALPRLEEVCGEKHLPGPEDFQKIGWEIKEER